MTMRLVATVLALLLASGCTSLVPDLHPASCSLPRDVVEIEIQGQGQAFNLPVVETWINDRGPYRMVLDSGSWSTLLSSQLADELGTGTGHRDHMASLDVELHHLARLRVGEVEFFDHKALGLLDERRFDFLNQDGDEPLHGLLGLPSLAGCAVELDFAARTLRLHRDYAWPEPDAYEIEYDADQLRLRVDVVLDPGGPDEWAFPCIVDTGSGFGITTPSDRAGNGIRMENPGGVESSTLYGETIGVYATLTGDALIGNVRVHRPKLQALRHDPDASSRTRGIVGMQVLEGFVLTFEPNRRRARLVPRPSKTGLRVPQGQSRRTDHAPLASATYSTRSCSLPARLFQNSMRSGTTR